MARDVRVCETGRNEAEDARSVVSIIAGKTTAALAITVEGKEVNCPFRKRSGVRLRVGPGVVGWCEFSAAGASGGQSTSIRRGGWCAAMPCDDRRAKGAGRDRPRVSSLQSLRGRPIASSTRTMPRPGRFAFGPRRTSPGRWPTCVAMSGLSGCRRRTYFKSAKWTPRLWQLYFFGEANAVLYHAASAWLKVQRRYVLLTYLRTCR